MKLSRRKKQQDDAQPKSEPRDFQQEVQEKLARANAALKMEVANQAAGVRDAWLEDQEILKDFYEHVVLQDSDEGLPSIQSTLPKWLKAHLLNAYRAGYGHSSVRIAGLVVEITRLQEVGRRNAARILALETALLAIRDKSRPSDEERGTWILADEALRPEV